MDNIVVFIILKNRKARTTTASLVSETVHYYIHQKLPNREVEAKNHLY
jgi:hypothetical protein